MPSLGNYKISSITEESPITAIIESDALYVFGEDPAVVPVTETILASFTVSAGQTVLVKKVQGEIMTDATMRLYIDSTKVWQGKNAWTDRNFKGDVLIKVLAGEVITLKVIHGATTNHAASGGVYMVDITSA